MHIKFVARGSGSGVAAADYLTGKQDANGRKRGEILVLRGDPAMVGELADSLDFKQRYTSGVIVWAPEDNPSMEQLERVLDEFEATAWAGLEPDRYAWSAVLHREEGGGVHVHILTARVDLETGKSLNIAPPGWQKTFDPLRDWQNYTHGWARPDDPERERMVQPGHRAFIQAAQRRQGLDVEPDARQLINEYVISRIEAGAAHNRKDVLTALHEAGLETPRQGRDYITAADPETGQKWRLKGHIYGRDWRLGQTLAVADGTGESRGRGTDKGRAAEAHTELARARVRRATYNRERYRVSHRGREQSPGGFARTDARDAQTRRPELAQVGDPGPESLRRHLWRELGDDAVLEQQDPRADSYPRAPEGRESRDGGDDWKVGPAIQRGRREWALRGPAQGLDREDGMDGREESSRKTGAKVDDRDRDEVTRSITAHGERVDRCIAATAEADRGLAALIVSAKLAARNADAASRKISIAIKVKERMRDHEQQRTGEIGKGR